MICEVANKLENKVFLSFTKITNLSAVAATVGSSALDDCGSSTVDSWWTTSNDAFLLLGVSLAKFVLSETSCVKWSEACAVVREIISFEKSISVNNLSDFFACAVMYFNFLGR